jgi:two-component system, response regulator PdtaR
VHVLLIEDRFDVAALIADELRDLGCTSYDIVDTEIDAIRTARARPPDLIIADERLAQGSGLAAVDSICSRLRVATVFISADPSDVLRSMAHVVLLEKPFSAAAFVVAIERALSMVPIASPPADAA